MMKFELTTDQPSKEFPIHEIGTIFSVEANIDMKSRIVIELSRVLPYRLSKRYYEPPKPIINLANHHLDFTPTSAKISISKEHINYPIKIAITRIG